jgi:hypothetical protein
VAPRPLTAHVRFVQALSERSERIKNTSLKPLDTAIREEEGSHHDNDNGTQRDHFPRSHASGQRLIPYMAPYDQRH